MIVGVDIPVSAHRETTPEFLLFYLPEGLLAGHFFTGVDSFYFYVSSGPSLISRQCSTCHLPGSSTAAPDLKSAECKTTRQREGQSRMECNPSPSLPFFAYSLFSLSHSKSMQGETFHLWPIIAGGSCFLVFFLLLPRLEKKCFFLQDCRCGECGALGKSSRAGRLANREIACSHIEGKGCRPTHLWVHLFLKWSGGAVCVFPCQPFFLVCFSLPLLFVCGATF